MSMKLIQRHIYNIKLIFEDLVQVVITLETCMKFENSTFQGATED